MARRRVERSSSRARVASRVRPREGNDAALRAALTALLRGVKRVEPVDVGHVHFIHFWRHEPVKGRINVAWIKDLRSLQFAQMGYVEDYLDQARHYLEVDRARFARCNAFVAPTPSFAEEVMRWYGARKPWFQFANYPDRVAFPPGAERRREAVYIDNATAVFQPELYRRAMAFLSGLREISGYEGILVPPAVFVRAVLRMGAPPPGVRVVPHHQYDNLSEAGLLVNVTNFRGAGEALPRKLLHYLHCGMKPLLHATFAESVHYCRRAGIVPLTYYGRKDAALALRGSSSLRIEDRDRFCIEERLGDLVHHLRRLGEG